MVESQEMNRPATDVSFVSFTNGNSKKNAEAFTKWVSEREFKRSQLLSITMNESDIEEGDNIMTVFYRDQPIAQNELTFDDLKFHHFPQQRKWDDLTGPDAKTQMAGKDVVGLIHTPKNIGGANN